LRFAASPLLARPQGVSVFQDGVRINEAFGTRQLRPRGRHRRSRSFSYPGLGPAFGLNTLGGALAIYTKSGAHTRVTVELSGGSFRRKDAASNTAEPRRLDYFATGHVATTPAGRNTTDRVRQFFGKIGYQDDVTDFDVSATLATMRSKARRRCRCRASAVRDRRIPYPPRWGSSRPKGQPFPAMRCCSAATRTTALPDDEFSAATSTMFRRARPETGVAQANEATMTSRRSSSRAGARLPAHGERQEAGLAHQGRDRRERRLRPHAVRPAAATRELRAGSRDRGERPFGYCDGVDLRNDYYGLFRPDTVTSPSSGGLRWVAATTAARIVIGDRSGGDARARRTARFRASTRRSA